MFLTIDRFQNHSLLIVERVPHCNNSHRSHFLNYLKGFLIRQTPQVQREIRALFVRLGLVAPGITRPARRATGSSKPRKLVPKSVRRKKAR